MSNMYNGRGIGRRYYSSRQDSGDTELSDKRRSPPRRSSPNMYSYSGRRRSPSPNFYRSDRRPTGSRSPPYERSSRCRAYSPDTEMNHTSRPLSPFAHKPEELYERNPQPSFYREADPVADGKPKERNAALETIMEELEKIEARSNTRAFESSIDSLNADRMDASRDASRMRMDPMMSTSAMDFNRVEREREYKQMETSRAADNQMYWTPNRELPVAPMDPYNGPMDSDKNWAANKRTNMPPSTSMVEEQPKLTLTAIQEGLDELMNMRDKHLSQLTSLDNLLEKTILREGDILRNKRRERDGHRDPHLLENRKLQADVKEKIEGVRKIVLEIEKKIRSQSKLLSSARSEEIPDNEKSIIYEAQVLQNSVISTSERFDDDDDEEDSKTEFYDPGSHWCRDCDKFIPKVNFYFEHMHTKEHWQHVDCEKQPWKKAKKTEEKRPETINKNRVPIKGVQFLVPIKGFYCPLCSQFCGDAASAYDHLKTSFHNKNFSRFSLLNQDYEHKWNFDRGKALSRHQACEKKRKMEEMKEKEEKEKEAKRRKLEEEKRQKEKEKEIEREENRKREEEKRKRDKESREREQNDRSEKSEKENDKHKSDNRSSTDSSERFRLKGVLLDLTEKKREKESNHREREKNRNKDQSKDKKRSRSVSLTSSTQSNDPLTRYFQKFGTEVPNKDKKLKMIPRIDLTQLDMATARKFHCDELIQVLKEAKNKPVNKLEKIEFDYDDEADDQLKLNIDEIVSNFDEHKDYENELKHSNKNKSDEVDAKNDSKDISDTSDAPLLIDESFQERSDPEKEETVKCIEDSLDKQELQEKRDEETLIPHHTEGSNDSSSEELLNSTKINVENLAKNGVSLTSAANKLDTNDLSEQIIDSSVPD